VVGLAPSAASAEVLADAVGIPTENIAKWLTEQHRQAERNATLDALRARLLRASPSLTTRRLLETARSISAEIDRWQLRPGQLVIVDEASMAATADLDTITTYAAQAGAKVLLVGDWAQLSPVSAGGAFHLLAHDRDDVATLHEVRRFTHAWERDASLRLRTGDPAVVEEYLAHDRVQGGDRESMLDLLYEAWRTDTAAGLTALMIAADTDSVLDLNRRAQADRLRAGEVAAAGADLADGTSARQGDLIVTRRNDRRLTAAGGDVKNGDRWRVLGYHSDGALTVQRPQGGDAVRLAAAYVTRHVELGYATTAQRAQGRTVDRAHAYVSPTVTRQTLYVMASRGAQSNNLYVDTHFDRDTASGHDDQPETTPDLVLREVLASDGIDRSATTVLADEWMHSRRLSDPSASVDSPASEPRPEEPGAARPTWRAAPERRQAPTPRMDSASRGIGR
jgi:ATP-dependent exoDNAse (exonuclease V) alpha subunit